MSEIKETPNYYAIIPAVVRYSKELSANAKLLYGEITALCNEHGYCWAGNEYFANLYGVKKTTISEWISSLVKNNFLAREMIYKEGTKEIEQRVLRLVEPLYGKKEIGYPIEKGVGIPKKPKENNTYEYTRITNTCICEPKTKTFKKPTKEEIRQYCLERNNNVDIERFYDHYEAVGWKIGRNSMKDWKAAVRTWEKNYNDKCNKTEITTRIPELTFV